MNISEFCKIYTGTGFPIEFQGKKNGKYPFYKVSDISVSNTQQKIFLDDANNYIDEFDLSILKGNLIPAGTIVFAKIGEALKLNKRAITSCECLIDNNVIGIKPDDNIINLLYFYYYLLKIDMLHYSESTTLPSVRKSTIEQIKVKIPPIDVQNKRVTILNICHKIIKNQVELIHNLDLLVKSRFDELFLNTHSIETIEIGELFEVGSSKRILQSELTTYGIPFYRVTDLINRINDRPVDIKQYVDELKYMTLIKEKYVPQAGDFLITARGTIGKIYEVKQNDKFYFQDGMITWLKRKNNYINNLFFMELVKTDWFRRQFYSSNNGTTISYLSITDTRHLKVLLPALNLQLQFAQEVYQINKLKSDVRKSIDETQLLMDSLMQEYFG